MDTQAEQTVRECSGHIRQGHPRPLEQSSQGSGRKIRRGSEEALRGSCRRSHAD